MDALRFLVALWLLFFGAASFAADTLPGVPKPPIPATQGTFYAYGGGTYCGTAFAASDYSYTSEAAAANAIPASQLDLAVKNAYGVCNVPPGGNVYEGRFKSQSGGVVICSVKVTFSDGNSTNNPDVSCGSVLQRVGYGCGPNQVLDGTMCLQPPDCPTGYTGEAGTSTCSRSPDACQSYSSSPVGAYTSSVAAGGVGCMETASGGCAVVPTGPVICSVVNCTIEAGRFTGATCQAGTGAGQSPTTLPDGTPPPGGRPQDYDSTCQPGDLWCKMPSSGGCPAGMTRATFGNTDICVQAGSPVSSAPAPTPTPPLPPNAPPQQPGEVAPGTPVPNIGVGNPGSGATPPGTGAPGGGTGTGGGGTGTGTGGGGTTDRETCGLPNTPKCKIDETGTPDKLGDEVTKSLDDALKLQQQVEKMHKDLGDGKLPTVPGEKIGLDLLQGIFGGGRGSTCELISLGPLGVLNLCPWLDYGRALMQVFWFAALLIYAFRRANDAVQGQFKRG